MYKVFFKDRSLIFTSDLCKSLKEKNGLFYRFGNVHELKALVIAFHELHAIENLYIVTADTEEAWKAFNSCFKLIEAGGGLVRNRKGEFLFMLRRNAWDLPKGKKDKGESLPEAARREVGEETGLLHIKTGSFITTTYHSYILEGEYILKHTHWFQMEAVGDEFLVPEVEEEITELRWIRPENIGIVKGNTFPLILEVLEKSGHF